MANKYAISPTQIITAPNGIKITIYTDGDKKFVKLTNLYKALGFAGQFGFDTTFGLIFKDHRFAYFQKRTTDTKNAIYVVELNQVIPVLEAYIRISLVAKSSLYQDLRDNARMEAQRLIEVFNREVFGKPDTVITKPVEKPDAPAIPNKLQAFLEDKIGNQLTSNVDTKEDTQMENPKPTDKTVQNTVPIVTVADIEDISARADVTVKVFGVSKADALRAVTKLKAEEINRDLAPLLELLG